MKLGAAGHRGAWWRCGVRAAGRGRRGPAGARRGEGAELLPIVEARLGHGDGRASREAGGFARPTAGPVRDVEASRARLIRRRRCLGAEEEGEGGGGVARSGASSGGAILIAVRG